MDIYDALEDSQNQQFEDGRREGLKDGSREAEKVGIEEGIKAAYMRFERIGKIRAAIWLWTTQCPESDPRRHHLCKLKELLESVPFSNSVQIDNRHFDAIWPRIRVKTRHCMRIFPKVHFDLDLTPATDEESARSVSENIEDTGIPPVLRHI